MYFLSSEPWALYPLQLSAPAPFSISLANSVYHPFQRLLPNFQVMVLNQYPWSFPAISTQKANSSSITTPDSSSLTAVLKVETHI